MMEVGSVFKEILVSKSKFTDYLYAGFFANMFHILN